ncbi:MAG: hypothetical protein ACTHN5_18860 [Phycisphaerae bacterium]
MPEFLIGIVWALTLVLSLAGWGRLAQRVAGHPATVADWLDAPSVGLGVLACLGGVLNLAGVALPEVLLGVAVVGVAVLVPDLNRRREKKRALFEGMSGPVRGLLAAVVGLLVLRVAGAIVLSAPGAPGVTLNPHDDMHSYLVSVARLLQTGTVGIDPFNSRQMTNSLGAAHFLNALGVAVLPFDSIHLMDDGVGLVALVLSSGAIAMRLGVRRGGVVGVMLVPLAFEWVVANISSNLTSAATMVALASAVLEVMGRRGKWRDLLPAGLLLAATCGLKSTMVPAAGVFMVGTACLAVGGLRSWRPLKNAVQVGVLAGVFLLPWMIWQYESSGTFLYPVLGRGVHVADGTVRMPLSEEARGELARNLPLPGVCFVIVAGLAFVPGVRRLGPGMMIPVSLAFMAVWIIQWPLLAKLTQYPDLWRYILPVTVPGVVVGMAFLWRAAEGMRGVMARYVPVGGMIVFLAVTAPQWVDVYGRELPHDLGVSVAYEGRPWGEERGALAELQEAVPAREGMLVYMSAPALLNFERNRIYVVDWPGESSPAPPGGGLPIEETEALADYQQVHNIH